MSDAEYERERRRLQERLSYLENPETKTVLDAGMLLETLAPAWEKATTHEKRDILRLMFDAVFVDLEEATIVGLVPKPAFRLFFDGQEKEEDLAQLCKIGEELYLDGKPRCDKNVFSK